MSRTSSKDGMDVHGKLVDAANKARFNGTPPERVNAALDTLNGNLTQLPPGVVMQLGTDFNEIREVVFHEDGRMAAVGKDRDGEMALVECDINIVPKSRIVASTTPPHEITHLFYSSDRESVAYVVRADRSHRRLYWGDFKVYIGSETHGEVVSIHCFGQYGQKARAFVIYERNGVQSVRWFSQSIGSKSPSLVRPSETLFERCKKIEYLGRVSFADRHVFLETGADGRQRVHQLHKRGNKVVWSSAWYDEVVRDSVMCRGAEDEFGFMAFDAVSQGIGTAHYVTEKAVRELGFVGKKSLFCLKDGGLIVLRYAEGPVLGPGNHEAVVRGPGTWEFTEILSDRTWHLTEYNHAGSFKTITSVCVVANTLLVQVMWGNAPTLFVADRAGSADGPAEFYDIGNPFFSNLRLVRTWESSAVFLGTQDGVRCLYFRGWESAEFKKGERPKFKRFESLAIEPQTEYRHMAFTHAGLLSWHFVNGTLSFLRYMEDLD